MSSAIVVAAYSAVYAIACTLELRRVFLRSSSRAAAVAARRLTIVALFVQTIYLATRVFTRSFSSGHAAGKLERLVPGRFVALRLPMCCSRRSGPDLAFFCCRWYSA